MTTFEECRNPAPRYTSSIFRFFSRNLTALIPSLSRPLLALSRPSRPETVPVKHLLNPRPGRTIPSLIDSLQCNKSKNPVRVEHLTIYTQNIWFSEENQADRFSEIISVIETHLPDFVCLQECIPAFVALLRESELVKSNYFMSAGPMNPYGVQILSRWPCSFTNIPYTGHTCMARSLLCATTVINGRPLVVSTTHLESQDGQPGMELRIKQLETAFTALKPYFDGMIMGDFNYDPVLGRKTFIGEEEKCVDPRFVDLYGTASDAQIRSDTAVDSQIRSDTILPYTHIKREERLDRMLLRGRDWEPTGLYKLVGTQPLPKFAGMGLFEDGKVRGASDHLGIMSVIKFIEAEYILFDLLMSESLIERYFR